MEGLMTTPIEQFGTDEDRDFSRWPEPQEPPSSAAAEEAAPDQYAEAELQRRHERTQVMIKKAREQLL